MSNQWAITQGQAFFLTEWSEWTWTPVHACEYRYRVSQDNEYHYEYRPAALVASTSSAPSVDRSEATNVSRNSSEKWKESDAPSTDDTDTGTANRDSNSTKRPFSCPVKGCAAGVKSWTTQSKLNTHIKNWHGPFTCENARCSRGHPNGFGTSAELDAHQASEHKPQFSSVDVEQYTTEAFASGATQNRPSIGGDKLFDFMPSTPYNSGHSTSAMVYPSTGLPSNYRHRTSNTIRTRDSTNMRDEFDPRFKAHKSKDFTFGRIFKLLWSEPTGTGGTEITHQYGETAHHKIRRFLTVASRRGHCLCIPILTYGGRGTLKYGVHAEDHAAIYSSRKPSFLGDEEDRMKRAPVRCEMMGPEHNLDPASRLNYAKIYTVEHNVKVWFIGKVHRDYEQQVVDDYNDVNKPLPPRSAAHGHSDENYFPPKEETLVFPTFSTDGSYPAFMYPSAHAADGSVNVGSKEDEGLVSQTESLSIDDDILLHNIGTPFG